MRKFMDSIKKTFIFILLLLTITGGSAFAKDNNISLQVDNTAYSISLPEGWSIKDNGEYSEFIRGNKALGGYYLSLTNDEFSMHKLEEVLTTMGRVGIYRDTNIGDNNKIYALFSSKSNSPAIFLYTSEDTLERDKFMLKMLLINIKAKE